MKFDDCRLPPRSAKAEALKVGDIVQALMKQEGDTIFGWQKAKIKELKVKVYFVQVLAKGNIRMPWLCSLKKFQMILSAGLLRGMSASLSLSLHNSPKIF